MDQLEHNSYLFQHINHTDFASIHYCEYLSFVICTARAEYIPIEEFKEMFLRISDVIKENPVKHLLFDKRELRTFHQPSMEWYFTIWKPTVSKFGLTSHFKILPDLEWFKAAVNAGKHEILSKFPDENFLEGITITYVNSPEEAIDTILQK